MTDDVGTWVVAALQVVGALVIAAFWITWFRQPHDQDWLPIGYVEHERVFVFPDSLLATLLVVSAALSVAEEPLGRTLSLVCAGMLTFLGVIDLAYFWQHGMFKREREGLGNLGVVVGVLLLAGIIVGTWA
jgi:hypothetical protein